MIMVVLTNGGVLSCAFTVVVRVVVGTGSSWFSSCSGRRGCVCGQILLVLVLQVDGVDC